MPGDSSNGIIDILLNQNIIDIQKLQDAKNESLVKQVPIDQVLLQKKWITSQDIVKAKSILFGVPYIDISNIEVNEELINAVSEDESTRFKTLIFEGSNGVFKAAMANPLDIQTLRYFEQKLKGRILVYIASEDDLNLKIKASYSKNFTSEVSTVVEEAVSSNDFVDISNNSDESLESLDVSSAPVAKIVNLILESAANDKASDIHIEPQGDRIRVRFRIHGILREVLSLPFAVHASLISRIKILGRMQIDEKRKPLDGRFHIKVDKQEIDLRISSLPTILGEKMVIRLLRKDLGITNLEDTGMRGSALKLFNEALRGTAGIILVTGPTGSGKTVTVATSMNIINRPEVNVVSIEDPVEIKIPGVNQVQVNNEAGLTFASALRSFLRQDPNVISVGEVRDAETAQLAAQASLTGHLVISTLHTNSAAGALPRLTDMGVEPYIIASSVNICAAQRLCRKICDNCKYAYIADEADILEIKKVLGDTKEFNISKYAEYQKNNILKDIRVENNSAPLQIPTQNPVLPQLNTNLPTLPVVPDTTNISIYLFKGKGCDKCDNTGYTGRIGIFEAFKVTEKIGSLVMQHSSSDEIEREARNNGMLKMIEDGYFKCLDGLTTIEEVQRVIHA